MPDKDEAEQMKSLQALLSNPIGLALLGSIAGGGAATTANVGFDLMGMQSMREDVSRIESRVNDLGGVEWEIAAIKAEIARAADERRDLEAVLGRLDRNVLIMCQQSGARCQD